MAYIMDHLDYTKEAGRWRLLHLRSIREGISSTLRLFIHLLTFFFYLSSFHSMPALFSRAFGDGGLWHMRMSTTMHIEKCGGRWVVFVAKTLGRHAAFSLGTAADGQGQMVPFYANRMVLTTYRIPFLEQ
jgi:hypothetical protein